MTKVAQERFGQSVTPRLYKKRSVVHAWSLLFLSKQPPVLHTANLHPPRTMPHKVEDAPVIPYQFWEESTHRSKQSSRHLVKPSSLSKLGIPRLGRHHERDTSDRIESRSSTSAAAPVFPSFMFGEDIPIAIDHDTARRPYNHRSMARGSKTGAGPTNTLGVAYLKGTKEAARRSGVILDPGSYTHRSRSPYPQDSPFINPDEDGEGALPEDYPYSIDHPPPPEAYDQLEVSVADKYRFTYGKADDETHKPELPPSRKPLPFKNELLRDKTKVPNDDLYWQNERTLHNMQSNSRGYVDPRTRVWR